MLRESGLASGSDQKALEDSLTEIAKRKADSQSTAREAGGKPRVSPRASPRASPRKPEAKPAIDPKEAVAKKLVLVRLNATHGNWERNAMLHNITLNKCKEDEYPALPT